MPLQRANRSPEAFVHRTSYCSDERVGDSVEQESGVGDSTEASAWVNDRWTRFGALWEEVITGYGPGLLNI